MGDNNACGLCLEANNSNFKISEDITKKFFDVLPPALAVSDINEDFVICRCCLEHIDKLSNYKSLCLKTQESILSFTKNTNLLQPDLKVIYLSRKARGSITDLPQTQNVCRFCMEIANNNSALFLNDEQKDIILLKAMLGTYFIELDLDITTNPVMCLSCKKSLQSYSDFINRYLVAVERKNKCHGTEKLNSIDHLNLCDIKDFTLDNTFKFENDYCNTNVIKKENFDFEVAKDSVGVDHPKQDATTNQFYLPGDTLCLATNGDILQVTDDYMNTYQIGNSHVIKEDLDGFEEVKIESYNCTDVDENEFDFKIEGGNIESEQKELIRSGRSLLPDVEHDDSETTEEHGPSENFNKALQNAAPPQSENVNSARSNSTKNKKITCQVCTYRTRYPNNLKLHMLSHKNLSEVVMFKCDLCSYQSRYKSNKTKHMLSHKSSSEVQMHKCEFCSFVSKYKVNLAKHMWVHKEAPEYKCDVCPFRTKRKGGLIEHTLIHKSPAEVTMYSCAECHFQTKHKRNLARHVVVHRSPS